MPWVTHQRWANDVTRFLKGRMTDVSKNLYKFFLLKSIVGQNFDFILNILLFEQKLRIIIFCITISSLNQYFGRRRNFDFFLVKILNGKVKN